MDLQELLNVQGMCGCGLLRPPGGCGEAIFISEAVEALSLVSLLITCITMIIYHIIYIPHTFGISFFCSLVPTVGIMYTNTLKACYAGTIILYKPLVLFLNKTSCLFTFLFVSV